MVVIFIVLVAFIFLMASLIITIVDGGSSPRLHKKLINEEGYSIGINIVSIQRMFGYGNSFHYVALYLDEKNIGHAKECIVYKKTVYWMD